MQRLVFIIFLLIPFFGFSQQPLNKARQSGWYTYAYKISAVEALQFIDDDQIPVDRFLNQEPFLTFKYFNDSLPIGHYLFISAVNNVLKAELYNKSNIQLIPVNNYRTLQFDVRDNQGNYINSAQVFFNKKQLPYNPVTQTYVASTKNRADAYITVKYPGDTLIVELEEGFEMNYTVAEQRRMHFKRSSFYKIISWGPRSLKALFNKKSRSRNQVINEGYVIFSQPKFKPRDTVKFKGYLLDKKWKQYKKPIEVHISYAARGQRKERLITRLNAVSAGAYIGEFPLADSIPSGTDVNLLFKTSDGKQLLSRRFRVEDYLLDEITNRSFRADKEKYYLKDSLHFFAASKDANGLYIMDGNAELLLVTNNIQEIFKDTLYIRDTLYRAVKPLINNGETKFVISADHFPKANLGIQAILNFKNSNNEVHTEIKNIEFKYSAKELIVTQRNDSIFAELLHNGKSVHASGTYDKDEVYDISIDYPFKDKIDPLIEEYYFNYIDDETILDDYIILNNYKIYAWPITSGDSLGFELSNPYKIPVYYSVYEGKKLLASGKDTSEMFIWKRPVNNKHKTWSLLYEYYWGGEEIHEKQILTLDYKILNIAVDLNKKVFPGQEDSIKIKVTDYNGSPASDVNLTMASYNNQFGNLNHVETPPYLVKYKTKKFIEREEMLVPEENTIYFEQNFALGDHKKWMPVLGLDTMSYYKLLFPKKEYHIEHTPISGFIPQLAVHVFNNGVQEEIYLLYINGILSYYNGNTVPSNYAIAVYPEKIKIGIRLKDKFIEFDSLYFQPNYKHDLSIDINSLPASAKLTSVENYWSDKEIDLLEKSLWQIKSTDQYVNSYVWQDYQVYKIKGNGRHIIGPFSPYEMKFYKPGHFNLNFKFESGYEYSLSDRIVRLEKHSIFPTKTKKHQKFPLPFKTATLHLGDTLMEIPSMKIETVVDPHPALPMSSIRNYLYVRNADNKGKVHIQFFKNDTLKYLILVNKDSTQAPLIFNHNIRSIMNLIPGNYELMMINKDYETAKIKILIKPSMTLCLDMGLVDFKKGNPYLDSLFAAVIEKNRLWKDSIDKEAKSTNTSINLSVEDIKDTLTGGTVRGTVTDVIGKMPIGFAAVVIAGSTFGVLADAAGNFTLENIKPGHYELAISSVGYQTQKLKIQIKKLGLLVLNIKLHVDDFSLQEVIVTSAFQTKRVLHSQTMVSYNNMNALSGRVAGLQIRIRGENSLSSNGKPIYVVDGIIMDDVANINPAMIESVQVLTAIAATALYGSIASGGAIVIQTKMKTDRTIFRDYAFWKPNFSTNKLGEAVVKVEYPDNITGWKTFVVGMDKKRRVGKSVTLVQSYKPMLAQINLPRFLLENDTVAVVTKAINYEDRMYTLETNFSVNDAVLHTRKIDLPANDANIIKEHITAANSDSIKVAYEIVSTLGYRDREVRKIPVFKIGTKESEGQFYTLKADTIVQFTANKHLKNLNIYAQNNTLELLLEELDMLKSYPYFCMEQISSKVLGYTLEKEIRKQLNQPFKHQKDLERLVKKLQAGQNYDGGWGWWQSQKSNIYISNYITAALMHIESKVQVETNLADAYQYLESTLYESNTGTLLASLSTLSTARYAMDYRRWMEKIHFDSLNIFQQWQWVNILKGQHLPYKNQLEQLVKKRNVNLLGGLSWGLGNYRWYSNEIATTILAFEVLQDEAAYQHLLPEIVNWFLTKRKSGYWRNTVESASITKLILPWALKQPNFLSNAVIRVSGDTNFIISKFPFKLDLQNTNIKQLSFTKSGGGMVYFTAYQELFNPAPQKVEDNFGVYVSYAQQGRIVDSVLAGTKLTMQVKIHAKSSESFVMIEIPIPAGCVISKNTERYLPGHVEKYEDKLMLFLDEIPKGEMQLNIELEPRYSGAFTVNPVKVSLMYFPIFYGRDELKKVRIWEPHNPDFNQ